MQRTLAIIAAMICVGCSLVGSQGLEQTALDYYEFRLGHRPGVSYSSFFSPEYVKLISKEDMELLDTKMRFRDGSNARYAPVKLADIAVSEDGRYALTLFRGQENAGMDADDAIRWVRVGNSWHLHMGTDTEGGAYGEFPANLAPPVVSESDLVETDPAG